MVLVITAANESAKHFVSVGTALRPPYRNTNPVFESQALDLKNVKTEVATTDFQAAPNGGVTIQVTGRFVVSLALFKFVKRVHSGAGKQRYFSRTRPRTSY